MGTRRIELATATALVAASLAVGTAAAASNTETTVSQGSLLDITAAASQTCGFPDRVAHGRQGSHDSPLRCRWEAASETLVQHYDGYLLEPGEREDRGNASERTYPRHLP